MIVLVGGGVRTGKSAFALERARRLGKRRVFLATGVAGDAEMSERIARHRQERGRGFRTVEAAVEVVEAVRGLKNADVVLLDCLTFWIANELMGVRGEREVLREVQRLVDALRAKRLKAVVVTNEVGMGLVPETPLGRAFRDVCGRAHQILAREADEVWFGAMGLMIRLKPDLGVAT